MNNEQTERPQNLDLPSKDWLKECQEAILWVKENKHIFLAIGIVLSLIQIYWYATLSQFSLNFSFLSIISSLPMIFVLNVAIEIIFAILIMGPVTFLFMPLKKEEPSLMMEAKKENVRKLMIAWFSNTLFIEFLFIVALGAAVFFPANKVGSDIGVWVVIAGTFVVAPIILFKLAIVPVKKNFKFKNLLLDTSIDFKWWLLACIYIQLLITMYIVQYVFFYFSSQEGNEAVKIVKAIGVVTLGAAVLGLIQCAVSVIFLEIFTSKKNPIKLSIIVATILVVLINYVPSTSNFFMAHLFQNMASGGRACVQLLWNPDVVSNIAALKGTDSTRSQPVRIMFPADEFYQVQLNQDAQKGILGNTYFVPRNNVIGLSSCQK
ncbi:hypothetical protein [Saezia sanguinis]|uniref:hypothetical protein n=1 Tax=Saezia sanguinis TaxID=1965230 RepID=UPI0030521641